MMTRFPVIVANFQFLNENVNTSKCGSIVNDPHKEITDRLICL